MTTEYIDGEFTLIWINISIYTQLSGRAYIELPDKLKHPKEGLIYFKSDNNKCFLWCHIANLNPLDKKTQRITKVDKTIAYNLDYKDINVPVSKKDYSKIEKKNNVCINVFCYENDLVDPVHISK